MRPKTACFFTDETLAMRDIEINLDNRPGQLALLGEILGRHQISLEGGGVFAHGGNATAHFLVEDAYRAKEVLEQAGMVVGRISEVVIQKLNQDLPGQLGLFCRQMADAGVNILVQYSDHSNQLILVVDKGAKAREVSSLWMKDRLTG